MEVVSNHWASGFAMVASNLARPPSHRGRHHDGVRCQPDGGARGHLQATSTRGKWRPAMALGPLCVDAVDMGEAVPHRARPDGHACDDVISVLELRIGIETEAAALAAQRRNDDDLAPVERRADSDLPSARLTPGATRWGLTSTSTSSHCPSHAAIHTMPELVATLGEPHHSSRARLEDAARDDRRAPRLSAPRECRARKHLGRRHCATATVDGARAAMRTHLANSRERRRRSSAEQR